MHISLQENSSHLRYSLAGTAWQCNVPTMLKTSEIQKFPSFVKFYILEKFHQAFQYFYKQNFKMKRPVHVDENLIYFDIKVIHSLDI